MILSKAAKLARAFRSAKKRAVARAETFSATATATNWFMLVPSSLLSRSAASFSDRGSLNGYVLVSDIYLSLPIASRRSNTATPNREGAIPKSLKLNVTNASARR
jgi:hypothetical protein